MFDSALIVVAVISGAVGAVAGFGIGSLLTPLLALKTDVKTAVAAVSLPHFVGTAIRFAMLRKDIDRSVLCRFGVASAAGGLTGALLHERASSPQLAIVFGSLLIFAGGSQLTGYSDRWRLRGRLAWIAGAASAFLGGLVGNQGGIRSAAMLGFDLTKQRFVATATAIALIVDVARLPVYAAVEGGSILAIWRLVLISIAGVVAGTLAGKQLLQRIPERSFRRVVGTIVLLLGIAMLIGGTG